MLINAFFMLVVLGFLVACLGTRIWGGRLRASIGGALLLGPSSFAAVGRALAGHLNPQSTRFQSFPFDGIQDSVLVGNLLFWTIGWGLALYFGLPKIGRRWR